MKIRKIKVTNYRGIAQLEVDVPPGGLEIKGTMGSGKTSLLSAIKACLVSQGISAENIRNGASDAEILVDLDDAVVKRSLHRNGSPGLDLFKDGLRLGKAQLQDLLGTSHLDPMDLLLLSGPERDKAICQALNIQLTVAQLRKWWPKCPDTFDCSGNGMKILETVRSSAYEARRQANATAKAAKESLKQAEAKAEPYGLLLVTDEDPVEAMSRAMIAWDDAKRARMQFELQATEAERAAKVAKEQRAKADAMREEASKLRVPGSEVAAERAAFIELHEKVESLERALADAKRARDQAERLVAQYESQNRRSEDLDALAKATEDGLLSLPHRPDLSVLRAAIEEEARAAAEVKEVGELARARDARREVSEARTKADVAVAEAKRLDGIVHALGVDAPRELLAGADVPKGFALTSEGPTLDGKKLDMLSDGEKVWFAVELARRANVKSKILVVDRFECIAPDLQERFKREAVRGGYQLLVARADAGALVFEAIAEDMEPDPQDRR